VLDKHFGKSSERIDPAQLELLVDGLEADAALEDSSEAEAPPKEKKRYRKKRSSFPDDLVERELEFDLPEEQKYCSATGKPLKFVRWEESTKYNFVPGHFERLKLKRAVYVSPADIEERADHPQQLLVTAEMAPEHRVIPGCMASAGLLIYILVAKYCDHLPLYRLQSIFKRRHDVVIDRNTMCHWIKRCAEILGVLYEAMRLELLSGNYLQIDETFIKLLDPDTKGKAKQSHFWVIKSAGSRSAVSLQSEPQP